MNTTAKTELISDKILSRIRQYSFARPNKYLVSFALPDKLASFILATEPKLTKERLKLINFNCSRIASPERRLEASDVSNSAHESRIAIAGEMRPPIQLGFICHSDMYEKYLFDLWLEFILHHKQRTMMFQCDYVTDIVITQLDQKHDSRYEITLRECFPIQVAAFNYDYQPTNAPIVIDVTFSFSNFSCYTIGKNTTPSGSH